MQRRQYGSRRRIRTTKLIHEKEFCRKILGDFGVDVQGGLIADGHVPVKLEKGESPIKASRHAITIDGAFSEVYGDKGFTFGPSMLIAPT